MRAQDVKGYSLVELLMVIGLLSLIAAVATPAFDANDEAGLQLAATEVARAMRFAHAEAIRSGQPYGVNASQAGQSVRVYRLDDSENPPVVNYDVYDPQTKQLYDLGFEAGALDASIAQVYFKFEGSPFPKPFIGFSAGSGVPKFNDSGTVRLLETGYVRVGLDGKTRTVSVSPVTGRVTIQ